MKNLNLYLDKTNFLPGEVVSGKVELGITEKLKLRSFFVQLVGAEKTRIRVSSGKHSHTVTEVKWMVSQRKDLWSGGEAEPGTYPMEFEFPLPSDLLPTYSGIHSWVFYEVRAQVDVPLWFDVKDVKRINVFPRSCRYDRLPFELNINYPSGFGFGMPAPSTAKTPGFFMRLDNQNCRPGQRLKGAVFVHNPTGKRIRKVDFTLRAKEWAKARGYTRTTPVWSQVYTQDYDDTKEGAPMDFSIEVPRDATVNYTGKISKLWWELVVNLDVAWAFDKTGSVGLRVYL